MKKQILFSTLLGALLVTGMAHAASWQESLSSAASELTKESGSTQGGLSASSLTSLLGNSSQSLSAGTMNNAAGILEYCAKQKLASVTDAQRHTFVTLKLQLSDIAITLYYPKNNQLASEAPGVMRICCCQS